MARPTLVKFGGELVQTPEQIAGLAAAVRTWCVAGPVVLVHGGGKEIDAALRRAGIQEQRAEGLRITDAATLDVVVAVLAGTINTRLVAGLVTSGVPAVGLTGVDAAVGLARRAKTYRTSGGQPIDLGLVGEPDPDADPRLLLHLLDGGYVPVVACVGVDRAGQILNINADVLAMQLAVALGCERLVIAGTTPGVLDGSGRTIDALDAAGIERLMTSGVATDGMVAKLSACREALASGVEKIHLVDGRHADTLAALRGTVLTRTAHPMPPAGANS